MNWRTTSITLGGALLLAVASVCYLARREQAFDGPLVPVVMLTRDLARGDVITRAALDVHELPERYLEERHIAALDLERVLGVRTTGAVASGSSLLWSDLDVGQEGRPLSALVRSGMRAFALPEHEVGFDGLLRPGDRVDVLFTPSAPSSVPRTLLQSVLVLTAASVADGAPQERDAHPAGRAGVTLSVTLEQAQQLAYREGRGRFRLALRNPHDLAVGDDAPSTFDTPLAHAPSLPGGEP